MSSTGTRAPNGSGTLRADGYRQVKLPGHPVAMKRGFAYVHRVVLYDNIGGGSHPCHYCSKIVSWGIDLEADHRDHDKQNNVPDNLVACCAECNRSRWNRHKTQCPNGHGEYTSTYANGWRYCKKCKAEKEARRRAKKKIKAT